MEKQSWGNLISRSVKNIEELSKQIDLTEEENIQISDKLDVRITPYYLDLIKKYPILRRTVVPTLNEFKISDDESIDPLDEDEYKKSECVIHKYPNRVLFTVTSFCSSYCRYCTRSRMVGDKDSFTKKEWNNGLDYISQHTEIEDVLLSGGDPLTLPNSSIDYLLTNLRSISHVGIVRIGTKVPVVLPQRIDDELVDILKRHAPIYINIHFTHKYEITDECKEAINKLRSSGAILGSQSVLLKGINNDAIVLKDLFYELLKIGVRPYYLYQMDRIVGGSHFRCDLDEMIDIMKKLISYNSGMSIPEFIIDTKIGKVPLRLDYVVRNANGKYTLTSFEKNKSIDY